MKFYVYVNLEKLFKLYEYCVASGIDITIEIRHSQKYGDLAVIRVYRGYRSVITLMDELDIQERPFEKS